MNKSLKTCLIIVISIFSMTSKAQNISIDIINQQYFVMDKEQDITALKITNNTSEKVLLWFDKNPLQDSTEYQKYKKYFYTSQSDGMSLMQWIFDGNVSTWKSYLFYSFYTIMLPKDSFYLVIVHDKNSCNVELVDRLKTMVATITKSNMESRNLKLLNLIDDLCMIGFSYKSNIMVVNSSELNCAIDVLNCK